MKNLENYGVQALNAKEVKSTDGGGIGVVLGLIALGIYLYDNRERIAEGFEDGYAYSQNDGYFD